MENNNCTAREACTINVGKIDDANDVVFVFFSDDEKVRAELACMHAGPDVTHPIHRRP